MNTYTRIAHELLVEPLRDRAMKRKPVQLRRTVITSTTAATQNTPQVQEPCLGATLTQNLGKRVSSITISGVLLIFHGQHKLDQSVQWHLMTSRTSHYDGNIPRRDPAIERRLTDTQEPRRHRPAHRRSSHAFEIRSDRCDLIVRGRHALGAAKPNDVPDQSLFLGDDTLTHVQHFSKNPQYNALRTSRTSST
ncbi:MAG TPA: hypothetical protein VLJ42_12475 [Solirubrobacteraceae bacterium]|nr:hypothetical protein [Solirubrobacteraceae bacterium]